MQETVRRRVSVEGIVQGVGFRPHVHRLARDLGLSGTALNVAGGLEVEIEGPEAVVDEFVRRIEADAPPIAVLERVTVEELEPRGDGEFTIVPSRADAAGEIYVSPDVAICADCARELRDPADRRFGHPFINCTNCGPRFTIVEGVPYDRPKTSMGEFEMCEACRSEYEDINDRRYHAQPVACSDCGPRVWFVAGDLRHESAEAIHAAQQLLQDGKIVAVKGLGGFHLACDADNDAAVRRLRERKHREAKPLAVMARDIETIRAFAHVTEDAETLLTGPEAPIVLLDRRSEGALAQSVAPDTATYGVLLPYTPLHILLLDGLKARALVMTSGNLTDEPLATDNDEAMRRLGGIASGFLLHDRRIFIGCDDSVVRPTRRGQIIMRRSRGFVPFPVRLSTYLPDRVADGDLTPPAPLSVPARGEDGNGTGRHGGRPLQRQTTDAALPCILAVGGHQKNAFCITRGSNAFLSQHIGDLDTLETLEYFERSIEHFKMLLQVEPEGLACDLHPDFLSTRYAEELAATGDLPLERVQHHHAHLAAVLADNRMAGPAVGLICDGTGYGADGTIWGCEVLVGDAAQYERAGHLRTIRLAGGEAAIEEPWRLAAAWLQEAFGPDFHEQLQIPFVQQMDVAAWLTLREMMARGINAPVASSAGRLFDAVAALIGLYQRVEYEAQAPMMLEAIAGRERPANGCPSPPSPLPLLQQTTLRGRERGENGEVALGRGLTSEAMIGPATEPYAFNLHQADEGLVLDPTPTFRAMVDGITAGIGQAEISARFHATFVAMLAEAAERVAHERGIDLIALSGGTFQNRIVLEDLMDALERKKLRAIMHTATPAGDGCVALGQAAVAQARWQ
ncbi:MAG: carbamoyltransferase HypF [candidate division WS1 bacterium]|nr:carbamoyltransferase HypF [candidate division WS1 bacterium]